MSVSMELGVVRRMLGEIKKYLIELKAVRKFVRRIAEVFDRVGSCEEF